VGLGRLPPLLLQTLWLAKNVLILIVSFVGSFYFHSISLPAALDNMHGKKVNWLALLSS